MLDEFVENKELDFEDSELSLLVFSLKNHFCVHQDNFACICRDVYRIWSYCKGHYYQVKGKEEWCNSYQVLAKFGFDKKAVSRYKQCYEKYVVTDGNGTRLVECFSGFSPSKLFEMLSLSQQTFFECFDKQLLRPEMTVKQIREFVKNLKNGTPQAEMVLEDKSEDKLKEKDEIDEAEIPMAYDPKQEYEYSYFESKTKNQLLNIVWELQKAYQKLKSKENKTKK